MLELSGWAWSVPATSGTMPSPRSGAAMTVRGCWRLAACTPANKAMGSFQLLPACTTCVMQHLMLGSCTHASLSEHHQVGNGYFLVIHGGRNNFTLDDVHVLDLMGRVWLEVRPHCACVAGHARHAHTTG